jgi:hypothetical protein
MPLGCAIQSMVRDALPAVPAWWMTPVPGASRSRTMDTGPMLAPGCAAAANGSSWRVTDGKLPTRWTSAASPITEVRPGGCSSRRIPWRALAARTALFPLIVGGQFRVLGG